jgi:hypothetical protein
MDTLETYHSIPTRVWSSEIPAASAATTYSGHGTIVSYRCLWDERNVSNDAQYHFEDVWMLVDDGDGRS